VTPVAASAAPPEEMTGVIVRLPAGTAVISSPSLRNPAGEPGGWAGPGRRSRG
jgi:hypothetical protein